jgi:hypothetical protein
VGAATARFLFISLAAAGITNVIKSYKSFSANLKQLEPPQMRSSSELTEILKKATSLKLSAFSYITFLPPFRWKKIQSAFDCHLLQLSTQSTGNK